MRDLKEESDIRMAVPELFFFFRKILEQVFRNDVFNTNNPIGYARK